MFALSSDGTMQWGDVTGDGVPENFMSVTIGAAVANAVCQQFVIPVFLPSELCEPVGGSGRFCQRSIAVPSFFLVRTICVTPNAPPMDARMRSDQSNVIFNVVRSGNYQIEDASSVSGTRGATVTFGIPLNPLFATAEEMGNRCPAGSVLLSSPALAPLGGNRLCVQTSVPPEPSQVSAQVGEALSRISSNPTAESVDANVSEAQSILDRVIGFGSANTSNPITLAASRSVQFISDGRTTRACFTTTNRTHPDHLLEGQVVNCLFDDGFGVKSLVIGTGSKTRNALANELAGPFLLGRVQDMLRGRVLARLDATRPPPPCRTCFPEPE